MRDLVEVARKAVSDAEERRQNALSELDPDWDKENHAALMAMETQKAHVETTAQEMRQFLLDHKPTAKSKQTFDALLEGARRSAQVVAQSPTIFVQANSIIEVAENCEGKAKPNEEVQGQ